MPINFCAIMRGPLVSYVNHISKISVYVVRALKSEFIHVSVRWNNEIKDFRILTLRGYIDSEILNLYDL